jgi:predicted nucleic acid-binding protein
VILVDSNILSSFTRVGELGLVFTLFDRTRLGVTPAVMAEINGALAEGCSWLEEVRLLVAGGQLDLVAPQADELLVAKSLPASLGAGEREAIALAQSRGWAFLTNDKRARNYCRQAGLRAYDLPGLLRAIWQGRVRSAQFVEQLCARIEAAEGMVIRNKEAIFRE